MKRIIALALIALIICLLFLTGCGNGAEPPVTVDADTQPESSPAAATEDATPSEYSITYNGTAITLHAPAAPIVEALGEPMQYTESASCAFTGLDKTYYYGSFYLDTYPKDGTDYVYGFWFADDSISNPEGIFIGASQELVEAAYGAESFNGSNAYIVEKGTGKLTVILEEGVVTSIQYAINM